MSEPFGRLRRFLRELKRRNVYKVAVAYLAVAFVGLQAAQLLVPPTTLPGWADDLLIYLAVFGFPIALVIAWAFEMTPEGMRRTETEEGEEPVGAGLQWIGLGLVVALAGGVWYVTSDNGGESDTKVTTTTDTTARRASITADSAPLALPARDRPFVAVLPMENLSPSEKNKFFAAGIHEEVLSQLSKVSGLGVFGRTTMEQYADTEQSIYEIGRELGAEAVMEGSVRRAEDRVRITVQLIDPASRDHLWSETYEQNLSTDAIFDIQADLAEQITEAVEVRLTEGERKRIEDAPTDDLTAYDAYLKGRSEYWASFATREFVHLDRSVDHLQTAVRRDSTFAEANAWLGLAYARRYDVSGRARWRDSASTAAERARRLFPESAVVQGARGATYLYLDSLSIAEEALRQAVDLQPTNSFAVTYLAHVLRRQSDYVNALRWADRAIQLDPHGSGARPAMFYSLWASGMPEAAGPWFRWMLGNGEGGGVPPQVRLAEVQIEHGNLARARAVADSLLEARPDHPWVYALAGKIALQEGEPRRAREYLERIPEARGRTLPEDSPSRPERVTLTLEERMLLGRAELQLENGSQGRDLLTGAVDTLRLRLEQGRSDILGGPDAQWAQLAAGLAALGQTEEALMQLERAAAKGFPRVGWLKTYPLFDDLRSELRFQEILRDVQSNQQKIREEVRQLDINLYPPGAEPDSVAAVRSIR